MCITTSMTHQPVRANIDTQCFRECESSTAISVQAVPLAHTTPPISPAPTLRMTDAAAAAIIAAEPFVDGASLGAPEVALDVAACMPAAVAHAASPAPAHALVSARRCTAAAASVSASVGVVFSPEPLTPVAAVWAAAAAIGDATGDAVVALQERRRVMKRERDQLTRDIRNADRRRARVVERARGLTDDDLFNIMATRAAAKAKGSSKAKAKARAKAKSTDTTDGA
jgi:hypothetical protein